MQLFSIGLVELNEDGSPRTSGGNPVDTYTPADISGLAKVFTGWSWACPEWPDNSCFSSGSATEVAMVSGLAPGSVAVTWMVGKSTFGSALMASCE
jgi:sugar/nucleoside kinase (ribokinase family)